MSAIEASRRIRLITQKISITASAAAAAEIETSSDMASNPTRRPPPTDKSFPCRRRKFC